MVDDFGLLVMHGFFFIPDKSQQADVIFFPTKETSVRVAQGVL